MHLTVYEQTEIFYYAFVFGLMLGIWYDFFRLLRALGFKSKRAFVIHDILFMSGCAVMCFVFALLNVNGHLRLFVLLGHLLGLFAYRFSFGILTAAVFGLIGKAADCAVNLGDRAGGSFAKAIRKCVAAVSRRVLKKKPKIVN